MELPSSDDDVVEVVAPGQTLGEIADAYGVTPEAIAKANGITVDSIIYPGQELVIPSSNVEMSNGTME
nr:LysM domain-containing protein [Staphylococcus simiae]